MKNICIQKPETFTCRDLSAGNIARKKLQFSHYHSKADQLICSGQPILFYFFSCASASSSHALATGWSIGWNIGPLLKFWTILKASWLWRQYLVIWYGVHWKSFGSLPFFGPFFHAFFPPDLILKFITWLGDVSADFSKLPDREIMSRLVLYPLLLCILIFWPSLGLLGLPSCLTWQDASLIFIGLLNFYILIYINFPNCTIQLHQSCM